MINDPHQHYHHHRHCHHHYCNHQPEAALAAIYAREEEVVDWEVVGFQRTPDAWNEFGMNINESWIISFYYECHIEYTEIVVCHWPDMCFKFVPDQNIPELLLLCCPKIRMLA